MYLELPGQSFYFGNDLSYVNQMEDCGAIFREDSVPKDIYRIFADHGTNLVRVRLWVDPSWWQMPLEQPAGVKPFYNDLEDVRETIQRSKSAGMQVMLDLHYSDFWADPGRQLIPRSWLGEAHELEGLKDSVYNYTVRILSALDKDSLMPEIVKIGNENNSGILTQIPEENGYNPIETVSSDWSRHAQLYNAAIKAVRDVGANSSINPKIAIHFSNNLSGQVWNFTNILNHAVRDFDIMGISYYYAWHGAGINTLESTIKSLVSKFPAYDIMVVETGYLWTTQNFDQMANIITESDPQYLPVIPEKQLEYMVDYTRAVMRSGGTGVVFWEPAWVSTPCRTPWGQGSSHDHVVFFDPVLNNFMENGGGKWTESRFYTNILAKKVIFKVDMTGQDVSDGVYISGEFTGDPWEIVPMANEGEGIYSYFTYLSPGDSGTFFFLNGNDTGFQEILPVECAANGEGFRKYLIGTGGNIISEKWGTCEGVISGSRDDEFTYREDFTINIYPNPGSGGISVIHPIPADRTRIDILDLSGRIMLSVAPEFYTDQTFINLSRLIPDLYILKFLTRDTVIYRKFVYFN